MCFTAFLRHPLLPEGGLATPWSGSWCGAFPLFCLRCLMLGSAGKDATLYLRRLVVVSSDQYLSKLLHPPRVWVPQVRERVLARSGC